MRAKAEPVRGRIPALLLCLLLRPGLPAVAEVSGPFEPVAFDTVAVMPFANATGDATLDWLCLGIPETITADLLALGRFVIVERLQLWRIMEEQALQVTGAVDDAAVVEIGKLLGARHLIVGAFQRAGMMMRLTARLVEAQSGNVIQSAKVTGAIEDIFDLQDQIVGTLVAGAPVGGGQTKGGPGRRRATASLEAYREYGQAVLRQTAHDNAGAWAGFRRALEIDPGFTLARERSREVLLPLIEGTQWVYKVQVRGEGELEQEHEEIWQVGPAVTRGGLPCIPLYRQLHPGETETIPAEVYLHRGREGLALAGGLTASADGVAGEAVYKPPLLRLPWEPDVGRQWIAVGSARAGSDGKSALREDRCAVLSRKEVEVPGLGAAECYLIRCEPVRGVSEGVLTLWFAPGIGIVRLTTGEEMKALPGEPSAGFRTTWELMAYRFR